MLYPMYVTFGTEVILCHVENHYIANYIFSLVVYGTLT